MAHGDDLGAENVEGLRIELLLRSGDGSEDRKAAHVSVVQDFDQFELFIAESEISFVENEGATEGVERMEDR